MSTRRLKLAALKNAKGPEDAVDAYSAAYSPSTLDVDDADVLASEEAAPHLVPGVSAGAFVLGSDSDSDSDSDSEGQDEMEESQPAAERKVAPLDPVKFRWLAQFTAANELRDEAARRAAVLRYNADFSAVAKRHGAVILSEIGKPGEKTIPPVAVGGVAGGEKFIVDGILFKLAVDPGMYGGGRHDRAAKAAAHELKGANAFFEHFYRNRVPVIVPIQLLIDAHGWRLVAMPLLPVDGDKTLIYGSCDAGKTVHNDDAEFAAVMEKAAAELHLARHRVGDKQLCAAGDVEGHRGTDGRLYLLDLARTFPAEHPQVQRSIIPLVRECIFYKLLRPEFLQVMRRGGLPALSSDALSGWGRLDAKQHNDAVAAASSALLATVKKLAAQMDAMYRADRFDCGKLAAFFVQHDASLEAPVAALQRQWAERCLRPSFDAEAMFWQWCSELFERLPSVAQLQPPAWIRDRVFNGFLEHLSVSQLLHSRGINVRHVGLLWMHVTEGALKERLAREMRERMEKQVQRAKLRGQSVPFDVKAKFGVDLGKEVERPQLDVGGVEVQTMSFLGVLQAQALEHEAERCTTVAEYLEKAGRCAAQCRRVLQSFPTVAEAQKLLKRCEVTAQLLGDHPLGAWDLCHKFPSPLVRTALSLRAPPLMEAALAGRADIIKSAERGDFSAALLPAAIGGHAAVLEALLAKPGVEVDRARDDGWTALLAAAFYQHRECVQLLLAKGADAQQRGMYGDTVEMLLNPGEAVEGKGEEARLAESPEAPVPTTTTPEAALQRLRERRVPADVNLSFYTPLRGSASKELSDPFALAAPDARVTLVQGGAGSGKSLFGWHLYAHSPDALFVSLPALTSIGDYFRRQCGYDASGDLREHSFLFILDGLDETGEKRDVASPWLAAFPNCRVMVSSRLGFLSELDVATHFPAGTRRVYLCPFTAADRALFAQKFGAGEVKLDGVPEELLSTPLLLFMALRSGGGAKTRWELYERFVADWVRREGGDESSLAAASELAIEMVQRGVVRAYAPAPHATRRRGPAGKPVDGWAARLLHVDAAVKWRCAPLVYHGASGSVSFVHKSILEFLAAQLLLRDPSRCCISLDTDVLRFAAQAVDATGPDYIPGAESKEEHQPLKRRLFDIVEASKGEGGSAVAAANAISILNVSGLHLNNRDFAGIRIGGPEPRPGVPFCLLGGAQLQGCNLRGADLRNVKLSAARLDRCDLRDTQMAGVRLGQRPMFEVGIAVLAVALSLDGKHLFSGSKDKTVKMWNVQSGKEVRSFEGHTDWVRALALSPDGKHLFSGSADKTVTIWNVESGKEVRSFKGHTGWVIALALSPDGKHLFSGSADKTVKMWNVESGKEVRSFEGHSGPVYALALSPDGKHLFSGSDDETVKMWNAESGKEVRSFKGHTDCVYALALSPDGKHLFSGSEDKTVKMWNAESGKEVRSFKGHTDCVYALALSPDGKHLFSGSDDNTVKMWNVESGECLKTEDCRQSSVQFDTRREHPAYHFKMQGNFILVTSRGSDGWCRTLGASALSARQCSLPDASSSGLSSANYRLLSQLSK